MCESDEPGRFAQWRSVLFLATIQPTKSKEETHMQFCKDDPLFVPLWEKSNLTVDEAAAYSGIGRGKIKEISNDDRCPFVLWVGTKRLIKRKLFDAYIEKMFSI